MVAIDRWQQTQALQQANSELTRLASFPELNPGPIIEVDLTGHVHYLNPSAVALFPECREPAGSPFAKQRPGANSPSASRRQSFVGARD